MMSGDVRALRSKGLVKSRWSGRQSGCHEPQGIACGQPMHGISFSSIGTLHRGASECVASFPVLSSFASFYSPAYTIGPYVREDDYTV